MRAFLARLFRLFSREAQPRMAAHGVSVVELAGTTELSDAIKAANADAEAALRSDKELQNQRDVRGVVSVVSSVVARFVASSLAKLFLLAAVLGGSASLAVQLMHIMTLPQALGVVCAVDLGAALLLVAFIRSRSVGTKAGASAEILRERAAVARGGLTRAAALHAVGHGHEGEGHAEGGLAALLETALVKVLGSKTQQSDG